MAADVSGSGRSAVSRGALTARARAKVNLSLEVLGRRRDGYHELASLVVFAGVGDMLALYPDEELRLEVFGPRAQFCGIDAENLVIKATDALATRRSGLRAGRFELHKRLPVAAGLGGGSADAAAALRLLARLNDIALDDADLHAAAIATGADVPVCLLSQSALMRGRGEALQPLVLPRLAAVLVNPGVPVPTRDVFGALKLRPEDGFKPAPDTKGIVANPDARALVRWLASHPNDLAETAIALQPVIADVIAALTSQAGCTHARMSGSGATCFGLFENARYALGAARALKQAHPDWWVRATSLGERAQ